MQIEPAFVEHLMTAALCEARMAQSTGEVPVGAVVARDGEIIARAHNRVESLLDCCAHAEILAIRHASLVTGNWRLDDCTLCVTLEPCSMCIGAIRLARIPLIIFGASDPSMGAVGSLYDLSQDDRLGPVPRVISGIRSEESAQLIQGFFRSRREEKANKQDDSDSYWELKGSFQAV